MSWDALDSLHPKAEQEPTWGDYGQIVKGATGSLASGTVGGMRYLYDLAGTNSPWADKTFQALEGIGSGVTEQASKGMTEEGRKRYEAGITSPEFWEHPASSAAMKLTGQVPNFVAMATPAKFISGARAAAAAVMAAGGTLSANELIDNVYQQVDAASDADLRKTSKLYDQLRSDPDIDEDEARRQYRTQLMGMKPAIAFALGSAEGALGPIKNIVSGIKGGVRHGIIRSAIGGGASEAVEEGGVGALTQTAEIEGGFRKEYDPTALIDQALTGFAMGAGLGAVSGIGGKGKAKADEIRNKRLGEEDVEAQAPAGQAAIAVPPESAAAARAAKKGVTVGPDPAVVAALNEKTQAPAPTQVMPPEPPVPPPPAAPAMAAGPNAPPAGPPSVAQPQQANIPPTPAPAAAPGVTPQVTPTPAAPAPPGTPAAPAAPAPALDEGMLNEMARRGFTPEEAAQLTPAQIQEIMKQPAGGGGVSAPPGAATDISARARTPAEPIIATPEPSVPAQVATAQPVTPTEAFGPAEAAVPAGPRKPQVLQSLTPEAQANAAATQAAVQGNVKQAQTAAAEKVIGKGKKASYVKKAEADRVSQAEQIFNEQTSDERLPDTLPTTKEERQALAAQLEPMVAALKSKMELREDVAAAMPHAKGYFDTRNWKGQKPTQEESIRWYRSLPKRVGGKVAATGEARSIHAQYLRELVDVQRILAEGKDLGPKSGNRQRVDNFLTAFNNKAPDLIHMSREEAGQRIATERRKVGTAEEGEASVAARQAGGTTAGAVGSTQSTGAVAGSERVLGANEKAVIGAQALERLAAKQGQAPAAAPAQATEAKPSKVEQAKAAAKTLADKYAPKPEAKPEPAPAAAPVKKPLPKKVAEKVAITKPEPKITKETKPEPKETKPEPKQTEPEVTPEVTYDEGVPRRKEWLLVDTSHPDMHEGAREAHKELNKIKAWVNGLTEANYDRLPEFAHRQMQDTNDIEGVRRIAKAFEEEFGYNVLKEKVTAKHVVDVAQAAPVAPRQPVVATTKRNRATPAQLQAAREKMAAKAAGTQAEPLPIEGGARSTRVMQLASDEHDIWDTPAHKARDIFGHPDSSLSEAMSARDVLNGLNLEHLPDLPKYLQGFTRRRLIEIMGDTKIYIASPDLVRDANGGVAAGGYYHPGGGSGHSDYIVINSDSMKTKQRFAHVAIHESLHAALFNRINADTALRHRIQTLMKHMKSTLDADLSMQGTGNWAAAKYSLTNVHEFVSEALSNPRLQEIMAKIEVSPEMARKLHLDARKPWTMWGAFVDKVREALGFPRGTFNLLHETLKAVQPAFDVELDRAAARTSAQPQMLSMDALRDAAVGIAPNADTKVNAAGKLRLAKDKISTMWQMARRGEGYFGPSNPLHRLFEARAFMERAKDLILDKYGGLRVTRAIAKAEREHPEAMRLAKDIGFRASLHDVNVEGDNSHLGKDKLMGVQAKNEIAQLQKEWADKRLDPVRGVIRDAIKFYRDIHNAVSRETIKNILTEANIHDSALADRIHDAGLTTADREAWGDSQLVRSLDAVQGLKRRHGWYIPFRRYGDFSSTANHELSVPKNATKINDNTLQFVDPNPKNGTEYGNARARAAVKGYLRSNSHTPQGNKLTPSQIRKVWVDKTNPSEIVPAEDANAITAYRVSMQTQHTEMHETEAEAQNNREALEEAGLVGARAHSREKAYEHTVANMQSAMGAIMRSLEKQQRYIDADSTQKAAMREMFHDLTLGLSGTTSIKSSMRHRKNVAGMSQDLGRVTADYARMTTNHLAKLQHRPKIDAIFKEMRAYMKAHESDKDAIRRDQIYDEFVNRVYGRAAERADEFKKGAVSRVLQVTRLSFLAGPSYHIINAHEPWTTSLPVLGGDHGFGAATRAITNAYSLIGGRAGVTAGLKDMARAYTNDDGFTDYVKLFKDTIAKNKTVGGDKAKRLMDVIDYANARNLYSNATIFEMSKYANPEGNVAGRAIDRADLMANQVGTAIEAINRTVTLLPAYELEYKKNGGNHEAAMHYAYTKAHETMGDYSSWNAAPAFNTTIGRPLLQFKKFPQKTYYLLGNIMGGALKGDKQAMKQFAGLMVTHGLVAGALGMPTEPFKIALTAANMLGVTGFTPDDYEYAVRQLAARVAGQTGGEILSKGLYRGLGIEVSGRLGLDSLAIRGTPKSTKDSDIKTFLFDTMAGASGSFLLNQIQGAQAAFKGDFATAIEKMSPLRTIGDITKAVTGAAGEKLGPTGKVKQEQFGAWDATVRALGFTPSSVAERGAMVGTFKRESMQLSGERGAIVQAWVSATGADKVKAQRAVQEFNQGRPKDEQITQKDLTNAARRRKNEEKTTEHGITTSRRTQAIYDRAAGVFNP